MDTENFCIRKKLRRSPMPGHKIHKMKKEPKSVGKETSCSVDDKSDWIHKIYEISSSIFLYCEVNITINFMELPIKHTTKSFL